MRKIVIWPKLRLVKAMNERTEKAELFKSWVADHSSDHLVVLFCKDLS